MDPIEIKYRRWRSKQEAYTVVVVGVHHSEGKYGWYTRVVVLGSRISRTRRAMWPAEVFLERFEPLGRRLKVRSRWDRISSD